jgi:hypothetical protein
MRNLMTYTTKQTQFLETAVKAHGEEAILSKAVLAEELVRDFRIG